MAEPLTALATLSTATNIIQVIDFSAQVIKQIHKVASGAQEASEDAKRIEKLAERYQKLNIGICEHNQFSKPLTANDAAIDELASKSWAQANDLLKAMKGLKVDDSSRGIKRAVHGGAKVIKTAAQRHKLEQKEKDLQMLNGQLGTSYLHLLQQNLKSFHDDVLARIESIERRSGDTIKAVLDSRDTILEVVHAKRHQEEQAAQIIFNNLAFPDMGLRRKNIASAYDKTYEWIFTDTAWGLRDWMSSEAPLFWISGKAGAGKSTLMKFLLRHPETKSLLRAWAGDNTLLIADFYFWFLGKSELQKSEEGLLRSILFQILRECPHLIPDVCSKERWSTAIRSSHFDLWTVEELYEMLDRLATAGPILLNSDVNRTNPALQAPTDGTLHPSLECTAKQKRFALFIDGLDEFTGDQLRLVRQIKRLAMNPSFKLCVSSRPETVFNIAFGDLEPALRLEDLTRSDIQKYVCGNVSHALSESRKVGNFNDSLSMSPTPRSLKLQLKERNVGYESSSSTHSDSEDIESSAPAAGNAVTAFPYRDEPTELIEQIVAKASGVFLWVHLVVKAIVNGIVAGDSVATLSKRVDAFPPDLYEFFEHTLNRVDKFYARQTAQALLIAKYITEQRKLTGEWADSFLTYWLLAKSENNFPSDLSIPIQKLPIDLLSRMRQDTQNFLSACCKDLLQLTRMIETGHSCRSPDHNVRYQRVELLHKTVFEFLRSDYLEALLVKHDRPQFQDKPFWSKLAAMRLKLVPEVDVQGQRHLSCSRCVMSTCSCSYYFDEAAFVVKGLKQFERGPSRRKMVHRLEASSTRWLTLPCTCPLTRNTVLSLAKALAEERLNGPLLLTLQSRYFGEPDRDLLLAVLGVFRGTRFPSSEIDLQILETLYPAGQVCGLDEKARVEVCTLFMRSVVEEEGPGPIRLPLSRTTREVIILLIQRQIIPDALTTTDKAYRYFKGLLARMGIDWQKSLTHAV